MIKLRNELRELICKLRCIERLIVTPIFAELWDDTEHKNILKDLIFKGDKDGVKGYIDKHAGLHDLSYLELKERARKLQIVNWSRMCKCELIREIMKYEKA